MISGEGCGLVFAPIVHHNNPHVGQRRVCGQGHNEVVKEMGETVFFVSARDDDSEVCLDRFLGRGGGGHRLFPATRPTSQRPCVQGEGEAGHPADCEGHRINGHGREE